LIIAGSFRQSSWGFGGFGGIRGHPFVELVDDIVDQVNERLVAELLLALACVVLDLVCVGLRFDDLFDVSLFRNQSVIGNYQDVLQKSIRGDGDLVCKNFLK
jgi:hypothetical protein